MFWDMASLDLNSKYFNNIYTHSKFDSFTMWIQNCIFIYFRLHKSISRYQVVKNHNFSKLIQKTYKQNKSHTNNYAHRVIPTWVKSQYLIWVLISPDETKLNNWKTPSGVSLRHQGLFFFKNKQSKIWRMVAVSLRSRAYNSCGPVGLIVN